MRTSRLWFLISISAALCATPLVVSAQSSDPLPPPPKMQRLDEGEAPAVTITPPDNTQKITETRKQGKVTEVKVETGRTTYYAKPNDPAGSAMRGDAESDPSRPVQFQIGVFGRPKPAPAPDPVETLPPAPAK